MATSRQTLKSKIPHRILQDLKHQDWRVRKQAALRLQEVEPHINLLVLDKALHDESHFVGEAACRVMENIGRLPGHLRELYGTFALLA
jgi:hypothetical protein